jgi:predicted acyl esterase
MKRKIILITALTASSVAYGQNINGQIDDLLELSTSETREVVMPDGVKLMTDVYLPILQDCLMVPINIDIPAAIQGVFGESLDFNFQMIPRGMQYLQYDSIYDCSAGQMIKNANPYKLPMVFSRTPYNKGNRDAIEGTVIALLGYVYAVQDMRGRYSSEGVYLPLISDSWNKNAYHRNYQHVLDKTPTDDPRNGNRHEDGYNSIEFIKSRLTRMYDLDGNGIPETEDLLYNGRIAMFGASALGYNQYQAAAAHRINSNEPGLKAIMPIVAPAEFFKSTGFQNGVLRDRLVTGWLKGQIFTGTDDDLNEIDTDPQNNIHSSSDYDLPKTMLLNGEDVSYSKNKFSAANLAIDHFVSLRYEDAETGDLMQAGYYPNTAGRREMDVSRAMVDENGESVKKGKIVNGVVVDVPDSDPDGVLGFGFQPRQNLTKSRYTNMEVPGYHLSGWWDIFTDGQIESWAYMRRFLRTDLPNRRLQKLVLGPWAHQTMGQTTTGDRTYPDNTTDLIGLNFDEFSTDNIPISKALKSEVIGWFRYNLNYRCDGNGYEYREPKFVLPASSSPITVSQIELPLGAGTAYLRLRIPADTLRIPYNELLGILNGSRDLEGVTAELQWEVPLLGSGGLPIDVPAISLGTLIPGLDGGEIAQIPVRNFLDETDIPNVRMYVVGPNDDTTHNNALLGSYWLPADTFPLPEGRDWDAIQRTTYYMHNDGSLNTTAPTSDEGFKMYVHDPDDPIRSIGGNNMIVRTPDGERDSQGQFNLKDPRYASTTIDRPGVVQFTTEVIEEDSLCIVGFPTAQLWAKSNIGGLNSGPTDTDFFVRIVDVYPDGREYFVCEGAVNARARDYVKALVNDVWHESTYPHEVDQIPFSNIEIGQVYEYEFRLLPIAYTFGKGHRVKALVSSSNFTRYQVNPNLPIMPGEFFRRKPGDGRAYKFDNVDMMPRVAINRIHFSPEHPTNITLPIYTKPYATAVEDPAPATEARPDALVYPNPTNGEVTIYMGDNATYELIITDISGAIVATGVTFRDLTMLDVSRMAAGIYFVELRNADTGHRIVKKLTRN